MIDRFDTYHLPERHLTDWLGSADEPLRTSVVRFERRQFAQQVAITDDHLEIIRDPSRLLTEARFRACVWETYYSRVTFERWASWVDALLAAMAETTGLGWLSRLVQRVRPLRKATSSFDAVALASSDMIPGSLPALRRADWRGR